MNKHEFAKMVFEQRKEQINGMKKVVERYAEDIKKEVERGNYYMAAQYAQNLTETAYKVDALEKEFKEFEQILNLTKEDED